jgi:hypothetical protein
MSCFATTKVGTNQSPKNRNQASALSGMKKHIRPIGMPMNKTAGTAGRLRGWPRVAKAKKPLVGKMQNTPIKPSNTSIAP